MADVFISYNKADRDLVRLTAAFLEANGYSVWWDAALVAGDDFQLKILDEVAKARAVIVIWTSTSVKSTWVRSEAGRAQSDHKLITLKASGVTYDDIPPPFNLLHTEDASNRDALLLSVKSQMGKPAPAPVLMKKARHEVMSWIGVIGSVITLFSNLKGALHVAQWLERSIEQWAVICTAFWSAVLFFLPRVLPGDAIFLTMTAFATVAIVTARPTALDTHRQTPASVAGLWSAIVLLFLFFIAGLFSQKGEGAAFTMYMSLADALTTSLPLQRFGDAFASVVFLFLSTLPIYIVSSILKSDWRPKAHLQYAAIPIALTVIVTFTSTRGFSTGTKEIIGGLAMWSMFSVGFQAPAMLGALIGIVAYRMLGMKLALSAVNRRLWRIIAGIALLTAVNYGFLWLEKQQWAAELLK